MSYLRTLSNALQRSISPSKFESQATDSPSKLSVPNNRRSRNQPANRVHDIEFATEISTSLLSQVRHLQALLAEKEDAVKTLTSERSRLEIEAERFGHRLRELDESENRYKDENWNLETQVQQSVASSKEAAAREQKLTQTLNLLQAEKSAAQKELDEIKLSHSKLTEDHAAAVKHYDVELGSVKRSMTTAENERESLQRRVEDLIGQNQELARAFAHQRGRMDERDQNRGLSDEDLITAPDDHTPDHSPPPSPIKGTPRHSMLESETLKSSLGHAHRMIQNLKGNIHREKTEKLELKRMLQDARDDLDAARQNAGSGMGKRARKAESREFKKPARPGQLGQLRSSRSEAFIEDTNWEDEEGQKSPSQSVAATAARLAMGAGTGAAVASGVSNSNNAFNRAPLETDQSEAFETANEGVTETEDFQTGAEEMSSDELTETEGAGGTIRGKPAPLALMKAGNRSSFQSTASTSGDEYSYEDAKTPTQPSRLKLRLSRGGNRRSRVASEEPSFQQDSPASFVSSRNATPQAPAQSLFAELGDLGGSDEDESILGTPSGSRNQSQTTTPAHSRPGTATRPGTASRPGTARHTPAPTIPLPPLPLTKFSMTDSAMMTDPWVPEQPHSVIPTIVGSALAGASLAEAANHVSNSQNKTESKPVFAYHDSYTSTDASPKRVMDDKHTSMNSVATALMDDKHTSMNSVATGHTSDAASQWDEDRLHQHINNFLGVKDLDLRPISTSTYTSTYSDMSSQYEPGLLDEKLASFPEPPQSRNQTPMGFADLALMGAPLTMSSIQSEHMEPGTMDETLAEFPEPPQSRAQTPMGIAAIEPAPAPLTLSSIHSEQLEPIASPENKPITKEGNATTLRSFESVTPSAALSPAPLVFSSISTVATEPVSPVSPRRHAVIIPREDSQHDSDVFVDEPQPETPKPTFLGSVFGWNKPKDTAGLTIAEDETRQSVNNSPVIGTPESQLPLRELSINPHERAKRTVVETSDESSQTSLTANQIDQMMVSKREVSDVPTPTSPYRGVILPPSALRVKKSQESITSIGRTRSKSNDLEYLSDSLTKRPGSAGSRTGSITGYHPPLPTDHKEVIAAAAQRTGSSSGGPVGTPGSGSFGDFSGGLVSSRSGSSGGAPGSMGPPPLPNPALRPNPSFRPRTPNSPVLISPTVRGGTTPRPQHSSSGTAEIREMRSSSRLAQSRSRTSSVSSFVSEVDTRFNLRNGMAMPHGVDSNTDPRMINAITQTMIGEYLWKYTRKAGRPTMSENRHRRYFWVHPYTKTLYWSDRDPSTAGRAELKAKSVPIEAVRVVTDDNPMPPGLHRKSLVIMTPGRSVKFTATTGQRHETWFNALSYLLLRTGEDAIADSSDVANGAMTQEDVDEFNPGFAGNKSTRRGPGSLSSYNSRTTRNESPRRTNQIPVQPHLTPTAGVRPQLSGTFSRLSSYWKVPTAGTAAHSASASSKRSRHSLSDNGQIYEASEVHDSAEDLREIIERQDRESDKLENVRACCDGML